MADALALEQKARAVTVRWRRRVHDLLLGQLRQGITPRQISLTIAVGLGLGLFPILGSTTLLCLIAGVCMRLNQPVLQAVNWAASPLQIPGIYFFIRIGERITGAHALHFSIGALIEQFRLSPVNFLQQFGLTGLRGILAWLLIVPPLALLLYWALLAPLRRLATHRSRPEPPRVD